VIYNVDVCQTPSAWVMVIEKSQGGIRFKQSTNLANWSDYGGCMNSPPFFYCAAPTIEYSRLRSRFVLTALLQDANGHHYTQICHSTTLANPAAFAWFAGNGTYSSDVCVVAPEHNETNASDFAYEELPTSNGPIVCMSFAGGVQGSDTPSRDAAYMGSKEQFFAEFF
jgi:hypothetical protein